MNRSALASSVVIAALAAWSCTQAEPPREVAATPPAAAPAAPVASPAEVEEAIMKLERDWVAGIVKKDTAAVGALLAEDFVGTSPTAHTFTKEMALADLMSGKYVVESMDLDEISVNSYGDVAVAFTSQQEKSRYEGTDTSGHYHFTDVWVKKDGRWQVVASHGTRYAQGHAKS